jgi:hypothetical protein
MENKTSLDLLHVAPLHSAHNHLLNLYMKNMPPKPIDNLLIIELLHFTPHQHHLWIHIVLL